MTKTFPTPMRIALHMAYLYGLPRAITRARDLAVRAAREGRSAACHKWVRVTACLEQLLRWTRANYTQFSV